MEGKDFKIEFIPKFGSSFRFIRYCDTLEEAVLALNTIAEYTLVLHECSLMPDYSNMGMIFKRGFDAWIEIDDDGIEI